MADQSLVIAQNEDIGLRRRRRLRRNLKTNGKNQGWEY
jgi:hypothetical protein